jgi:hypothetical protein
VEVAKSRSLIGERQLTRPRPLTEDAEAGEIEKISREGQDGAQLSETTLKPRGVTG